MEAVILVGGKGSRLQSVVSDRPKPMALVNGRPFVEWVLMGLKERGIKDFLFLTGFMSDFIENYFGSGGRTGVNIRCSKDPFPLGTGGAVKQALPNIGSDPFLLLNGDSYCDFDLNLLRKKHVDNDALTTMVLHEAEGESRFGSVTIDDAGQILSFREKAVVGKTPLINAGIYLMTKQAFDPLEKDTPFSLEYDLFPALAGRIFGILSHGKFVDIGVPEAFQEVTQGFNFGNLNRVN